MSQESASGGDLLSNYLPRTWDINVLSCIVSENSTANFFPTMFNHCFNIRKHIEISHYLANTPFLNKSLHFDDLRSVAKQYCRRH